MTTGDKDKLFFSNFVYALPTQQDCVLVLVYMSTTKFLQSSKRRRYEFSPTVLAVLSVRSHKI